MFSSETERHSETRMVTPYTPHIVECVGTTGFSHHRTQLSVCVYEIRGRGTWKGGVREEESNCRHREGEEESDARTHTHTHTHTHACTHARMHTPMHAHMHTHTYTHTHTHTLRPSPLSCLGSSVGRASAVCHGFESHLSSSFFIFHGKRCSG